MSDSIDIMALYPSAVTPADLKAWNIPSLQDFNNIKAYYSARRVGAVNIGTPQSPLWEDRYELIRYEPNPAMMSRELKLFQEAIQVGNIYPTTRFYLTRTVSGLTVIPNAAWNVTSGNAVYNLATAYDGSTITLTNTGFGTAGQKMLNKTFVSAPLLAQTIKGDIIMQIHAKHDQALPTDVIMQEFVFFRLLNNDGTVAAEIGSASSDTNLPDTNSTSANKQMRFSALNISVSAGQRICFGVGGNYISGTPSARIRQNFGAPTSPGDLPYGNDVTPPSGFGFFAPWVEFSQPLKFQ